MHFPKSNMNSSSRMGTKATTKARRMAIAFVACSSLMTQSAPLMSCGHRCVAAFETPHPFKTARCSSIISLRFDEPYMNCRRRRSGTTAPFPTRRAMLSDGSRDENKVAPVSKPKKVNGAAKRGKDSQSTGRGSRRSTAKPSMASPKSPGKKSGPQQQVVPVVQTWRVFGVEVHPDQLSDGDQKAPSRRPRRNDGGGETAEQAPLLHPAVLEALRARLQYPTLQPEDIVLVRRSIDARSNQRRSDGATGPRYVYVLDVIIDTKSRANAELPKSFPWRNQPGRLELLPTVAVMDNLVTTSTTAAAASAARETSANPKQSKKPRVIIVGAGPAGLFCALQLVRTGKVTPIVLERGQPVESRGKDIGALMHRNQLDEESNFAFGEGGAGTWSDGKLTTRIGRNSDAVRSVLTTLVQYGAPSNILTEGAPHLGTDNLVRLLRNMRMDLRKMGGEIHFGTKVTGLVMDSKEGTTSVRGVEYVVSRETVERNMPKAGGSTSSGHIPSEMSPRSSVRGGGGINQDGGVDGNHAQRRLCGDAVVLSTGHSARDMYEQLHASGVQLEEKGFAVGYRVEHPQTLINRIQYGREWGPSVVTGKQTTDGANRAFFALPNGNSESDIQKQPHSGILPVPPYRLATNQAHDGEQKTRGVYSFCMCPGGQIVPASTNPLEVCVNGMSFSRRDSLWANSALVVTIDPNDPVLEPYRSEHGVLAGIAFQRDMERRAALMGGGNLTVPVQRLTDFLAGRASTSAPSSSYRLGVKPSPCHEIYPAPLITSLRHALVEHFDRQMPGYVSEHGLLHAVETRTSSPVRIVRNGQTLEAEGTIGLYPAGEGAGFAGGIVSAAVDGMSVADAVLEKIFESNGKNHGTRLASDVRRNTGVGLFY